MIKKLLRKSSSFPPIGKLRKGGKKRLNAGGREIMGVDLKFFRFDSQDNDAMAMFKREYGDEPANVDVYLVHDLPEDAFQFWQEEYRAGNLIHRCDGDTCVLSRKPDGTFTQEPKECPGNCKAVGRMFVILPKLMRFAYVTIETHSIHDILQLQDNLNAAYSLFGPLSRIPFLLSRRDRELTYIDTDGKPKKVTKSLLYLEPQPDMMKIRMLTLERERNMSAGLLPDTRLLETSASRTVNPDTGEIFDDEDDDDLPVAKPVVATPVKQPAAQKPPVTAQPVQQAAKATPVTTLIADKVKALYEEMLDTKSQALFVTWMIERYTSKQTPNDIRHKESELIAKEISTIVSALGERHEMYFDDFKESLVAQAQESEKQQALTVPESELVAA
jgi:hypothetical protein